MPFYEYECENCKFYTELLQKVSDAPLKKCPSCGKNTMKKLVSAPVFRLKGGGWYETDFKGDKENKRNLAVDKEPDTASDAKPAAGTGDTKAADSKPAAEAKPAESKASGSSASGSSGGGSSGSGSSSGSSRKASASRSSGSASKSRARPAAKSKAKPAARRKGK